MPTTTPYFVYLAKLFCLNSAKNASRYDKRLMMYNVSMVATYVAFLVLRAAEPTYDFLEINRIVIHLQLVAYVGIFAANLTTNWTKSTTLLQSLVKIESFDTRTNNHKATTKPRKWFWLVLGFLGYVVVTDVTVNIYVEESGNFFHWIAIFAPLVVNYVSLVCAMASFELLHDRFASLETSIERMLVAKAGSGAGVLRFANHFIDLTETTEAMFGCFSLQIGFTCLVTIVCVTNHIYLCLKVVDYMPLEYVTAVNFMTVHVVEIAGVVYACHVTKLKSDKVVAKATELLVVASSTNGDQVTAGVAAIKANRIENVIYGLITLSPATLLGMATTISTYLIIMLQFTSPNGDATRSNTDSYSNNKGVTTPL